MEIYNKITKKIIPSNSLGFDKELLEILKKEIEAINDISKPDKLELLNIITTVSNNMQIALGSVDISLLEKINKYFLISTWVPAKFYKLSDSSLVEKTKQQMFDDGDLKDILPPDYYYENNELKINITKENIILKDYIETI